MNPNPSRVLRLFAETQDRVYDGDTIKKMISQIARHTKDRKVIVNCEAIADLLQLEFDQTFLRNSRSSPRCFLYSQKSINPNRISS